MKKQLLSFELRREGLDAYVYIKLDSQLAGLFKSKSHVVSKFQDRNEVAFNCSLLDISVVDKLTIRPSYTNYRCIYSNDNSLVVSNDINLAVFGLVGIEDGIEVKIKGLMLDSQFNTYVENVASQMKWLYSNFINNQSVIKINIVTEI